MHFSVQGYITYNDRASLDKAVSALQEWEFMDNDRFFVDEQNERVVEEPAVNGLTITIPFWVFENFMYQEAIDVFLENSKEYFIIWVEIDGEYAGVYENDSRIDVDMEEWAAQNGLPIHADENNNDALIAFHNHHYLKKFPNSEPFQNH